MDGRAALACFAALAPRRECDLHSANRWDGLPVFLRDGRVEIGSNFAENRIRAPKLTAKNTLFAGHDEGAVAWARIASPIETRKTNDFEPHAWLRNTFEKIAASHPCRRSTRCCRGTSIPGLIPADSGTPADAPTGAVEPDSCAGSG